MFKKLDIDTLRFKSPVPGKQSAVIDFPSKAIMGIEAEFTLFVNDRKETPEAVFIYPQRLANISVTPRTGKSVPLPLGGALYFDRGVLEVTTPVIELSAKSAIRAGRSLWEHVI